MSKSGFYRTLRKYLGGNLSKGEKAKFDTWLDLLSTEKGEKKVSWNEADEAALFDKISNEIANPKKNMAQRTISTGFWLKAAASILLLVTASYFVVRYTVEPHVQITDVPLSEVEKKILNDGTIVWLKGQSKLSYYENSDGTERHAQISGEGFFEVAKDANRPFIIQCGEVEVTVVGTSFSLKSSNDSVELKLLTGKVTISIPENKIIDVAPNEKITYIHGVIEKVTMDESDVPRILASTEYNMKFSSATMENVINRIEKKFNVKFTVDSKQLNTCRITADFTDHSLESTLQMISEVLDMEYTISGSKVMVRGSGCN